MSDALEQRLYAEARIFDDTPVGDMLAEAAAELARLREALAQAEQGWDAARSLWLDERQEAEADLAACRGQREMLVAALTYASEDWADAPDVARAALVEATATKGGKHGSSEPRT